MAMEVYLLGTGSPIPDANRAGPTALVKAGDTQILLDAGRGVVMRLAGAGSVPPMLSAVLITHFHSDHVAALNDVITTHWVMSQGNGVLEYMGPPEYGNSLIARCTCLSSISVTASPTMMN